MAVPHILIAKSGRHDTPSPAVSLFITFDAFCQISVAHEIENTLTDMIKRKKDKIIIIGWARRKKMKEERTRSHVARRATHGG